MPRLKDIVPVSIIQDMTGHLREFQFLHAGTAITFNRMGFFDAKGKKTIPKDFTFAKLRIFMKEKKWHSNFTNNTKSRAMISAAIDNGAGETMEYAVNDKFMHSMLDRVNFSKARWMPKSYGMEVARDAIFDTWARKKTMNDPIIEDIYTHARSDDVAAVYDLTKSLDPVGSIHAHAKFRKLSTPDEIKSDVAHRIIKMFDSKKTSGDALEAFKEVVSHGSYFDPFLFEPLVKSKQPAVVDMMSAWVPSAVENRVKHFFKNAADKNPAFRNNVMNSIENTLLWQDNTPYNSGFNCLVLESIFKRDAKARDVLRARCRYPY